MTPEEQAQALFERYRRDAVLLHRPYPPYAAPAGNSRFGGLPSLPDRHAWPRGEDGIPLHFLAQVDCAEIPFASALPARGMLLFFGRDVTDDADWLRTRTHEPCRVLHLLDAIASTPPRLPPEDLPAIGGWHRMHHGEILLAGEPEPNVHVAWPIQPLRMDSWPDPAALPGPPPAPGPWRSALRRVLGDRAGAKGDDPYDVYGAHWLGMRERAFTRAASVAAAAEGRSCSYPPWDVGQAIFAAAEAAEPIFPETWLSVRYCARLLLHDLEKARAEAAGPEDAAAARIWLARADAAPFAALVAPADRAAFRDWLTGLDARRRDGALSPTYAAYVAKAAIWTIRALAAQGDLARRIAPQIYALTADLFNPVSVQPRPEEVGGAHPWYHFSSYGFAVCQMLGYSHAAQQSRDADDPEVCLLHLGSDDGLGWLFQDNGECTYWIEPGDLAKGDFSRVWCETQGH